MSWFCEEKQHAYNFIQFHLHIRACKYVYTKFKIYYSPLIDIKLNLKINFIRSFGKQVQIKFYFSHYSSLKRATFCVLSFVQY